MKKYLILMAAALVAFAACKKDDDKEKKDDAPKDVVEIGGITYKTVTLSNGQTWMAEPLRTLPEGATVSEDPASEGIVYSYKFTNLTYKEDGKTLDTKELVIAKDEASIKELGYLYDLKSVFGVEVTADNYLTLEGAQGICPDGWHIPTHADFMALVGSSTATNSSAAATDETALCYDADYQGAKIALLKECGFNYTLSGYALAGKYGAIPVSKANSTIEELYGYNSPFNYIVSSTGYTPKTGFQMFGLMTTFTAAKYPEGRVTLGYMTINNTKAQVRCIKNDELK